MENLMNEAAILTAKDGRYFINQGDVRQAFIKTGIGAEKKSRVISDEEKRITAYHEAGHAILFHVLPKMEAAYPFPLFPQEWGLPAIPCLCLRKMKCLIVKKRCESILWYH